jgi:prepilin-type N-terminal cleavage/methylation domain-containing protein
MRDFLRLEMCFHKKHRKGFTLLEVMITAAVLALGSALIYQSYFIAIDSFSYYSTLLKITPWMDEKIWQAQTELKHAGVLALAPTGQLEINNKDIYWSLAYSPLDKTGELYVVDLAAFWQQGARRVKLSRSAYAIYTKK